MYLKYYMYKISRSGIHKGYFDESWRLLAAGYNSQSRDWIHKSKFEKSKFGSWLFTVVDFSQISDFIGLDSGFLSHSGEGVDGVFTIFMIKNCRWGFTGLRHRDWRETDEEIWNTGTPEIDRWRVTDKDRRETGTKDIDGEWHRHIR